jgi:hypothetical protein
VDLIKLKNGNATALLNYQRLIDPTYHLAEYSFASSRGSLRAPAYNDEGFMNANQNGLKGLADAQQTCELAPRMRRCC